MPSVASVLAISFPPALRPLGTFFSTTGVLYFGPAFAASLQRAASPPMSFAAIQNAVCGAAFMAFCCYLVYHNLLRRQKLVLYRPGTPAPTRRAIASSDVHAILRQPWPTDTATVRKAWLGLAGERLLLRTAHGDIALARRLSDRRLRQVVAEIETFCGRALMG